MSADRPGRAPLLGLGLRLNTSTRSNWLALAVAAAGVALATTVLLLALAIGPALDRRSGRAHWRDFYGPSGSGETDADRLRWSTNVENHLGQRIVRIDVAAVGDEPPVPPGLERVPGPGETFVSPALADLLAQAPDDELDARYGEVVGTIGTDGLRGPRELVAIVGLPPANLPEYANESTTLDFPPDRYSLSIFESVLILIGAATLLAPVAIFIATATRLAAARREQRLATLRLMGATPRQVRRLAAVEGLVAAVPGAIAGALLFVALRPAAAQITIDRVDFFPTDLQPVAFHAAVLLLSVLVVAVVASQVTLRRLVISPLGVSRRRVARAPKPIRLVPLAVSLPLFAVVLFAGRHGDGSLDDAVASVGSFLLVIVGLLVAGPWLTLWVGRLVARTGGPARLLAGRRLRADARSGFRVVAAVMLAVFAGTFFHTLTPAFAIGGDNPPLDSRTFIPLTYTDNTTRVAAVAADLRSIAGVEDTLALVRASVLERTAEGISVGWDGWVAPCADVARLYPEANLDCDAPILFREDIGLPEGPVTLSPWGMEDEPPDLPLTPAAIGTFSANAQARAGLTARVIVDPSLLPADAPELPADYLAVRTDGDPHTLERARTALILAGFSGQTLAEFILRQQAYVAEVRRLVDLAVLVTLVIGGCSAAVAVSASVLERRWPFALLRPAGTPLPTLRRVVLLEALTPLAVAAVVSLAVGATVAQLILRITANVDIGLPTSLALLLGIGLAVAVALVAATLPLLGRVTSTESTRFE